MKYDMLYCLSTFLTFRWIPNPDIGWKEGWLPSYPHTSRDNQVAVGTDVEIKHFLKHFFGDHIDDHTGILLSGGIDSAILASYLPPNTKAYTIRFIADNAIDESLMAAKYASVYQLDHRIVDVTWDDYVEFMPLLMKNKKSPLHAVEVGLYKAAIQARNDGVNKLVLGNGADSTFGGMDQLLSKEWKFKEFVERYSFLNPNEILKYPISVIAEYEKYREGEGINYIEFLKYTHGLGIVQAFDNAIGITGCETLEPFEQLKLVRELDLSRIRKGEPKYLLYKIFRDRYPEFEDVKKIPFSRPMEQWMKNWNGPIRNEFQKKCIDGLTGDQKFLIYEMEKFLDLMEVTDA